MYVSEKKNKELFFTSEFVNDKTIKYNQKITLENEKYENLFLYDLIINEGISCEIQFELFLKMINDKYKINNERIKEDLFNNTKKLIMRKKDYFDFYLYISLFVESYTNKDFISKLLFVLLALIQKKIEITDITPERLEKLKDNFNNFKKNPKFIQIMFQEKEEKYQNIILELTYKVIFLFNYKLQANNNYHLEMLKMKENNSSLLKFIIKNYQLFENLIVDEEILKELIKTVDKFEDIENCLRFNHDFLIILKALNDNYDFIKDKFNETKDKNPIKLENYIFPKKDDNINDIIAYCNVFLLDNFSIISFSAEVLEKYVAFYNNTDNYIYLCQLKNFIKNIKKCCEDFDVKNLNKTYHDIGIQMINEGKFCNDEILSFVLDDYYYSDENLKNKNKNLELTPIEKFNIEKIEDNELEKWKLIKWLDIYKNQIDDFLIAIFFLVKKLKDFENISKLVIDDPNFKLKQNIIAFYMIQKFLSDFENEPRENLIQNLDIIIKIVELYMRYHSKTDVFENLLTNFDKYFVMKLFIELLLTVNINKKVIKNFLIKSIDERIESEIPQVLFDLIKIIGNRRADIFNKLNKFIIDEKSFFSLEENLKIKLLKLLISGRVLPNKESKNSFLKKSYEQIDSLRNKILELNYSYNEIYKFFQTKETINEFKERYGLLYFINIEDNEKKGEKYDDNFIEKKEEINQIVDLINNKFNETQKDINFIEMIINDLTLFYPNSHKLDIEEYSSLINQYKQIYYGDDKIFEQRKIIKQIKDEYYPGAEDRRKKKNSSLFKSIYEQKKKNKNFDETKSLIETLNNFNEMIKVLDLNLADEHIIKICVEEFKNKTKEEVKEEIERLAEIFNKKNILIDELADKYMILSYKENIINLVNSLKDFIEKTESKKTEYYKNLETIIFYCENNSDIEIINFITDLLKKLGIDLKSENNGFRNIFTSLAKIPGSIKFLLSKNDNDCRILHGNVNNGDDTNFLTSSDILHFQKCVNFMNNLGKEEDIKKMTDYELITKASNIFLKMEDKNYDLHFINLVDNYQRIKELFNQEFNKSEALRQKIKSICENSTFLLSNQEKNFFLGKYEIIEDERINQNNNNALKNSKYIKFDELEDLNMRIQMTKKNLTDSEEILITYQRFTSLMRDIIKIQSILNEIFVRGYPKEIIISIKIIKKEKHYEYRLNNEIKENFDDIHEKDENDENIIIDNRNIKDVQYIFFNLRNIIKSWKKVQREGYKEFEFLRYIFGRQFNILYKHLKKETTNKKFITHFLKYITNNRIKEILYDYSWKNYKKDELENIIYNFNEFINQNLKKNNLSIKDIYSNAKIILEEYKGFYLYYYLDKIEKELYQIYKNLTNKSPMAQNILFCNIDTSKEEIESFLYRAILCKENSCFMIGGIELLEFGAKNYLIEILNEIISEHGNNMNSCLIVLTFDKTTDIYKSLDSLKYTNKFQSNILKKIKEIYMDEKDNIKVVSSEKSGIGKSNYIKNLISCSSNKQYLYFPIGGMFSQNPRNEIFKRLENLDFNNKNKYSIHLDLNDNDDVDLMTDFLLEILILKSYKKNEDIIMLPSDINIIVEIPNSFINFEEKFPILTLIPEKLKTKILSKDLPLLQYKNKV